MSISKAKAFLSLIDQTNASFPLLDLINLKMIPVMVVHLLNNMLC